MLKSLCVFLSELLLVRRIKSETVLTMLLLSIFSLNLSADSLLSDTHSNHNKNSENRETITLAKPSQSASYEVYVDQNSGTFISVDEAKANHPEIPNTKSGRNTQRSASKEKAVVIEVTDLPQGGTMVDLRQSGLFKANYNVQRTSLSTPFKTNCQTHGSYDHRHI